MVIHDEPVTLGGSPSYPNSIAWSKENLIAVASGHLITILNPALPVRPRGLIKIPPINPFPIGVIKREEHLTPCVMPISLQRDISPCARSISWSPPGFAPNAGCLLAICTTEGRVKIYCQPFCEFRPEWVEVVDISDMLYHSLKKINFRELNDPLTTFSKEQVITGYIHESGPNNGVEDSISGKLAGHIKTRLSSRRRQESNVELLGVELLNGDVDHLNENTDDEYDPAPRKKSKITMTTGAAINPCSSIKQALSAEKSARQQPGGTENDTFELITARQYASHSMLLSSLIVAWSPTLKSSGGNYLNVKNSCSILAVGGKSGNISFWRIYEPQCYTVEHGRVPVDPVLIGLLQAHNSWISAISWGMHAISSSESQLILATGSCDGSVKIWLGDTEKLNKYLEADNAPLSLLREDNSVRSWVLHDSSLCEFPFPLSSPGFKKSVNLSEVSDLCFGLALSPGELVVAVVRSFDSELLNPMYQARVQKAAVEFYWTGGQLLAVPSDKHLEGGKETHSGLSGRDLVCWESTILWRLKHYDSGDEPLVLWDIIMALLAFRKSAPSFVQKILLKWISSWFMDCQFDHSIKKILFHVQSMLSKMSTRRIHFLNIICRRLMLGESKLDIHHEGMHNLSGLEGGGELDLWNKVLVNSERELQERSVSFTFKAVIRHASCSTALPATDRSWNPVGVAQMERWVAINPALVNDQLKLLAMKVGELRSRIHLICEYVREERCGYCSASVPFVSERFARCEGIKHHNGSMEKHDLKRCAVSMQLASITSPMWFCKCCERQAFNLPPLSFFTMAESPSHVNCESESIALQESSKPLCLFCGILLQRFLPDFLLSASPV